MSSTEKPLGKIVVTVVGGLILAVLLYIARHWLSPVLEWVARVLKSALGWVISLHAIPGWLIVVLCGCAAWAVARVIRDLRAPPKPAEPDWREFTEFEFLGVLWRWNYSYRGDILQLVSFCAQPQCDMQTSGELGQFYGPYNQTTLYKCDRCGHTAEVEGTRENIENKVIREIQRLLRRDEWEKHIRANA
jgi:hypothetical protein